MHIYSIPLALFVFTVFSIAQVIEIPSNPYHILNVVEAPRRNEGNDFYFCGSFNVRSDWDIESTHWSMEIVVEGGAEVTSLSNLQNPELIANTARGFPISSNTRFSPNESKDFHICSGIRSGVAFDDVRLRITVLLYFGSELTRYPSNFQPPKTGLYFEEKSICLPQWGQLSDFDIVVQNFGSVTYSRIGGKIAVQNDAIIDNLWDVLDSQFCNSACTGAVENRILESSIIVGGQIKGWRGDNGFGGFCQGFIQGSTEIDMSQKILDTVGESCPKITGESVLDFDTMFSNMKTASTIIAGMDSNGLIGFTNTNGFKLHLLFNDNEGSNIQMVFHVPGSAFSTDGSTQIELRGIQFISRPEIIVINIGGTNVEINDFNGVVLQNYMNKVIYNFYEAESVIFSAGTVYGTILAPHAFVRIISGATIEGSVFAKTLEGLQLTLQPGRWTGFDDDGECVYCADGFYGKECTECSCAYNEVCFDGISGSGACACSERWNSNCTACATGNYGFNCLDTCSSTCLTYGTCNDGEDGDGSCSCNGIWQGEECDQCPQGFGNFPDCDICNTGSYGPNCEFSCTSSCAVNGECSNGFNGTGDCLGCKDGFLGEECDQCESGFYGPDCNQPCDPKCLENGLCDEGPEGTGECICSNGLAGDTCTRCAVSGMYGHSCQFSCAESCIRNGFCNDGINGNGECICSQGFSGAQCETASASFLQPSIAFLILTLAVLLSL